MNGTIVHKNFFSACVPNGSSVDVYNSSHEMKIMAFMLKYNTYTLACTVDCCLMSTYTQHELFDTQERKQQIL